MPRRFGVDTTFGTMLRALRTGYAWSKRHQALLRISTHSNGIYRVDVAPAKGPFPGGKQPRSHLCWWDLDDAMQSDLLQACEPLRKMKPGPAEPQTFYVNDEGKRVSMKGLK